ncbi:MAG TPA: glycine zipper 2TM domain-containing protein [Casimicrobiaceae bacterium]|nr:glycine zipper 2TM domain-containing protein [Casimicrobiaceae bacterium]
MRFIVLGGLFLAVIAGAQPLPGTPAQPAPAPVGCASCGVVTSVQYVEQKGQGSGAGLVAGGIVGGVLGHQVGSGRGNTAATIIGAGAGAAAGNQIEKNAKTKSYWVISVNLDDGSKRSITESSKPAYKKGDRVKIVDGNRLALLAN